MPEGKGMFEGFWGHITEFIKRMKVVLGVFLVSILVLLVLPGNADFFATTATYAPLMSVIINALNNMFLPPEAKLIAINMSDPITLYVYAALVFAIGITLPVFAYEAYKFIVPALYPHEKKAIFPFISVVTVLFIAGAVFGFLFLAPTFVQGFFPFYKAIGVEELVPVMDFYSIIFFTIIISGLLFTLPAFFVLLVKFNILRTNSVTKHRKYLYGGLIIAALFISPGATPIGDLYLVIALAALVEISFFVGKIFERKRGIGDSKSFLSKWLATSNPTANTCRFCNSVVADQDKFCPTCKKYLGQPKPRML